MAGTYTQQNIDKARSVFGDDPSAVARGVASTMTQSPTFQEPIKGQAGAIDALQQIREYDQQLASQVSQGNQAQMTNEQAQTGQLAQFGSLGATPQETINKAQGVLPTTEMRTPTTGLLSPFVASGLASGQTKAATDTYDIAAQTRAELSKMIGSEAKAYGDAIREENARKELEAAQVLAELERQDKLKQAQLDNNIALAKLTGQKTVVNPFDGKTYEISDVASLSSTERTALEAEQAIVNDVKNYLTPKDLFIKYGTTADFNKLLDIYNKNSPYGKAKESIQELRAMYDASLGEMMPETTGDITDQINKLQTGAERTGARATKDILDTINNAITKRPETGTGPLSNVGGDIGALFGKTSKTKQLEQELNEIMRVIRKESTGVAFSPQEVKDLEKEIPRVWMQEANVDDKLNRLKQRMVQKLANYGIDATIGTQASGSPSIDSVAKQKGFDIEAARAEGYSDEEINSFLGGI